MAQSEVDDSQNDERVVRLARIAVIGVLLSTALLFVVAVVYFVLPASQSWAAPMVVVLGVMGIGADIALRRTWSRAEGKQGSVPAHRHRLVRAAEVAACPRDASSC